MELATFDINIIAPDTVNVADTFAVRVEVFTNNSLVDSYLSGPSFLRSISLSLLANYYQAWLERDRIGAVYTPNLWLAHFNLTAPLIASESSLTLTNLEFTPFNSHVHFHTLRLFVPAWMPPSLTSYFTRPINFISGQVMPEVEIIITWPDN